MNTIEHIVFDIGRVLIHYDPEIPFRQLIPDAAEREWFFANVCTPAWNIEQDRGRSWTEAEAELVAIYPDHEKSIRAFRRHWHEMVPHHHEVTVDILRRLVDEGHDVTLLTNFAADTLCEARERFDFLNITRGITVSGEVGLIKPDPAIYRHHVEAFELNPETTLFIDDSAANIESARKAGWQGIHLTAPCDLPGHLEAYSLA